MLLYVMVIHDLANLVTNRELHKVSVHFPVGSAAANRGADSESACRRRSKGVGRHSDALWCHDGTCAGDRVESWRQVYGSLLQLSNVSSLFYGDFIGIVTLHVCFYYQLKDFCAIKIIL